MEGQYTCWRCKVRTAAISTFEHPILKQGVQLNRHNPRTIELSAHYGTCLSTITKKTQFTSYRIEQ